MAPEQALGDPDADHRADIYAWGVVAWEMIAGMHPSSACKPGHAMIAAHVSDTPPRLDSKRAEAPVALAALIMRCLEKTPARRPASAAEVLDALDVASTPSGANWTATPAPRSSARRAALIGLGLADGAARWTEKYDRPLTNVFAVQDEIARVVAGKLLGSLGGPSGVSSRVETADPEAYALFLQGQVLFSRRTAQTLAQAVSLFEQAV